MAARGTGIRANNGHDRGLDPSKGPNEGAGHLKQYRGKVHHCKQTSMSLKPWMTRNCTRMNRNKEMRRPQYQEQI